MKTFFTLPRLSGDLRRLARQYAKEGRRLNIMDDFVFKAVFTSNNEDSREALRLLLSSIIHREVSRVKVLNTEILPERLAGKTIRLDILAAFNDGEQADLEMQLHLGDDDLRARAALYAARLLSVQARRGRPYRNIKRVYQIFFINEILFSGSGKLPRRYFLQEETEHDRLTEMVEVIFYELPKLEGVVKRYLEGKIPDEKLKSLSEEEKWCIYFRYQWDERAGPLIDKLAREEEGIMRAEKVLDRVTLRERLWAWSYMRDKASMDYHSGLYNAREQGRTEERERAAGEKLGIARRLKARGMPYEEIAEVTGLPSETIGGI